VHILENWEVALAVIRRLRPALWGLEYGSPGEDHLILSYAHQGRSRTVVLPLRQGRSKGPSPFQYILLENLC